jgi:hypothetical protein
MNEEGQKEEDNGKEERGAGRCSPRMVVISNKMTLLLVVPRYEQRMDFRRILHGVEIILLFASSRTRRVTTRDP